MRCGVAELRDLGERWRRIQFNRATTLTFAAKVACRSTSLQLFPSTNPFTSPSSSLHSFLLYSTMSDKIQEYIDIPRQFVKEGHQVRWNSVHNENRWLTWDSPQFINRCTKPTQTGEPIE